MPKLHGVRFQHAAAARALREGELQGKASVGDLVKIASGHDDGDKTLDAAELKKGATELYGIVSNEYAPDVLRRVKKQVFGDDGSVSDLAVLQEANGIDEGAGYLNRYELQMAATKIKRADGSMNFTYKGRTAIVDELYRWNVDGKPVGELTFSYGDDACGFASPQLPNKVFASEEQAVRGLIDAGAI